MIVFTFAFAAMFALLVLCLDNAVASYPGAVMRSIAYTIAAIFLVVALVLLAVH